LSVKIDTFFRAPTEGQRNGPVSVLYLLRREVQDCLIGTVITEDRVLAHQNRKRLFASAMLIFTGVDLLAKFAAGDDRPGGVRARFVAFLMRFGRNRPRREEPCRQLTESEAHALYRFRNGLMHSFGMYTEDKGGTIVGMTLFQSDQPCPVVQQREDGTWELSIDDLYEMFFKAILGYREALSTDPVLPDKFGRMFDSYGTIFSNTLGGRPPDASEAP
jgi:hypothetical protein